MLHFSFAYLERTLRLIMFCEDEKVFDLTQYGTVLKLIDFSQILGLLSKFSCTWSGYVEAVSPNSVNFLSVNL